MKTPDRIWLIDMGDEITWCDDPDPSGEVHPDDTVEYVKAEVAKEACKQGMLDAADELHFMSCSCAKLIRRKAEEL